MENVKDPEDPFSSLCAPKRRARDKHLNVLRTKHGRHRAGDVPVAAGDEPAGALVPEGATANRESPRALMHQRDSAPLRRCLRVEDRRGAERLLELLDQAGVLVHQAAKVGSPACGRSKVERTRSAAGEGRTIFRLCPKARKLWKRPASRSQAEVAAGGHLKCLHRADVALDEGGDASVPGLGGDPVDADAGECRGGGVAGT